MFGSICYHVNTFHLLCAHVCLISCDRGRIFRPLCDRANYFCYGRENILCHLRVFLMAHASQNCDHLNNFHPLYVRVCDRSYDLYFTRFNHLRFYVHVFHVNIFHLLCVHACDRAYDRVYDRAYDRAYDRVYDRACVHENTFPPLYVHACVSELTLSQLIQLLVKLDDRYHLFHSPTNLYGYYAANYQRVNGNALPHLNENDHHRDRDHDRGDDGHVHVNDHDRDDLHHLSDSDHLLCEVP